MNPDEGVAPQAELRPDKPRPRRFLFRRRSRIGEAHTNGSNQGRIEKAERLVQRHQEVGAGLEVVEVERTRYRSVVREGQRRAAFGRGVIDQDTADAAVGPGDSDDHAAGAAVIPAGDGVALATTRVDKRFVLGRGVRPALVDVGAEVDLPGGAWMTRMALVCRPSVAGPLGLKRERLRNLLLLTSGLSRRTTTKLPSSWPFVKVSVPWWER